MENSEPEAAAEFLKVWLGTLVTFDNPDYEHIEKGKNYCVQLIGPSRMGFHIDMPAECIIDFQKWSAWGGRLVAGEENMEDDEAAAPSLDRSL